MSLMYFPEMSGVLWPSIAWDPSAKDQLPADLAAVAGKTIEPLSTPSRRGGAAGHSLPPHPPSKCLQCVRVVRRCSAPARKVPATLILLQSFILQLHVSEGGGEPCQGTSSILL